MLADLCAGLLRVPAHGLVRECSAHAAKMGREDCDMDAPRGALRTISQRETGGLCHGLAERVRKVCMGP